MRETFKWATLTVIGFCFDVCMTRVAGCALHRSGWRGRPHEDLADSREIFWRPDELIVRVRPVSVWCAKELTSHGCDDLFHTHNTTNYLPWLIRQNAWKRSVQTCSFEGETGVKRNANGVQSFPIRWVHIYKYIKCPLCSLRNKQSYNWLVKQIFWFCAVSAVLLCRPALDWLEWRLCPVMNTDHIAYIDINFRYSTFQLSTLLTIVVCISSLMNNCGDVCLHCARPARCCLNTKHPAGPIKLQNAGKQSPTVKQFRKKFWELDKYFRFFPSAINYNPESMIFLEPSRVRLLQDGTTKFYDWRDHTLLAYAGHYTGLLKLWIQEPCRTRTQTEIALILIWLFICLFSI